MLQDGILMAEQFVIQQPKLSCDLQHSTLAQTGLNRWSKAQSDQLAGDLKLLHLYICPNHILLFQEISS